MPASPYGAGNAIIEPVKEEAPAERAGAYFLKGMRGADGLL